MKAPSLIRKGFPTLYEQIYGKKPPKAKENVVQKIVQEVEREKILESQQIEANPVPIKSINIDPKK